MQLSFGKDKRTDEVARRANELALHLKKTYPAIDPNIVALAARFRKSRFDGSLDKRPALSEEEYSMAIQWVRESGDYAAGLLVSKLGEDGARKVKQIIDDHLEHYDGSGPLGKKGDQIILEAYVLNLSVAIQNMIEGMPNRNSPKNPDVLENVIGLTGTQYPPLVIAGSFRPLEKMLLEQTDDRTAHLVEMGFTMASLYHDLGNYLTELSLQIDVLSIVAKDNELVRKRSRACKELMDRMSNYVTQMLSFAKGDQCRTMGDVHEAIDDSLTLVSSKLNQVEIEKQYRFVPEFYFFRTGLTQVFANLIKNSAEAMKLSGKIVIKTSAEDGHAIISIIDKGKGMDEHSLSKVFSGHSTKEDGHGIGTQFCSYVVRRHGGTIFYESKEGIGTTVTVSIPLSDKE